MKNIISIVIGGFGTVTKGSLKGLGDLEIRGRAEIIHTTTLLRTTKILRRVLRLEETAVTLTSVKDHLLKLKGETLKE